MKISLIKFVKSKLFVTPQSIAFGKKIHVIFSFFFRIIDLFNNYELKIHSCIANKFAFRLKPIKNL